LSCSEYYSAYRPIASVSKTVHVTGRGRGESDGHAAGADDVGAVEEKSLPDQRHVALAADEALVVPVTVVERRELGRRRPCSQPNNTIKGNGALQTPTTLCATDDE